MMNSPPSLVLRTLILAISFVRVIANPLHDQKIARRATDSSLPCFCMPGDACWPSETEWATLNVTIGGSLIATAPLANVCHDPTFNAQACTALQAIWTLPQTQ